MIKVAEDARFFYTVGTVPKTYQMEGKNDMLNSVMCQFNRQ